jgi:hypothetical protein
MENVAMRMLKLFAAGFLLANTLAGAARAADGNAGASVNVGTIQAHLLNSGSDWGNREWLYFCGWKDCGDLGGGWLHKEPCDYDGIACLKDSKNQTFARLELNGHLAQAGVVKGSVYDCLGVVATCTGAAGKVKDMKTLAAARGLQTIYGDGLQIKFSGDGNGANGNPFLIDTPVCLDMGVDGYEIADPLTAAGVIWTEDTTVLQLQNGGCIENAGVVIAHYAEEWPTGPQDIGERYAVRQYMTDQGQTGVSCLGGGCTIKHVAVGGYDNPVETRGPRTYLDHLKLDGNVFLYAHDKGDSTQWTDLRFGGFLSGGEAATEYFSIDDITCSGGNHLRVKLRQLVDGPPLSDIADNMLAWISGLTPETGGTSAWDSWTVDKISSDTFDLTGSVCSGAALAGPSYTLSAAKGSLQLTGATNQTNVHEGDIITGSVCLNVSGTSHVQALWPSRDIIVMDLPASCAIASASLTFSGGAVSGPLEDCVPGSGGGQAPCFVLTAVVRQESGDSPAGIAAGHQAVGLQCGEPIPEGGDITGYKVAGLQVDRVSMYGVAVPFHLVACEHFTASNFATDSIRKVKDNSVGCALLEGDIKIAIFRGGHCGKTGQGYGILIDAPVDNDDQSVGSVLLEGTSVGLEVDQGKLVANGLGTGGTVLVANTAKSVQLNGNYSHATMVYEGPTAVALTDTSGAKVNGGASWWGGHFEPGGIAPAIASGGGTAPDIAGSDSAFRITVGAAPGTTTIVVNFARTWANAPACNFTDETTAAVLPKTIAVSTSSVSIGALTGLQAADKISGTCTGWSN